jgi:KaiC/GvpD/RAD55 family RecA-like ATPase
MPHLTNSQSNFSNGNIPNDLVNFLKQDTYSLIIKGVAGTGKTTLALTILKEMQIKTNCLYISTRISPEQLFQYYPWLEEAFGSSRKMKLTDGVDSNDNSLVFVDARLDEPGSLFERITNQLMDVKAPTIIIDTWDAIGFFMDKEALMNNARVLQTWRERAGAKLIFVTESPNDNTFDFLADGVIELKQGYHNNRRIREIFLSKLRGSRISNPSCIFSLNGGIFQSYEHYEPEKFTNITISKEYFSQTEQNAGIKNSHMPSGYEELDQLFGGGFPNNGLVTLELDTHVNTRVAMAFLNKIVARFVQRGTPVLFQPFEGVEPEHIDKFLKSQQGLKPKCAIEIISNKSKTGITDYLSTPKQDENKKRLQHFQNTVRRLKIRHKKGLLSIIGSDMTRGFPNVENGRQGIENLVSFIKSNSTLSIFVTRQSNGDLLEYLSEISDIHLKILEINGSLFLQSDIPWSHLYAIVSRNYTNHNEISIDPIV